ncbi:hypothetical protein [Methylobacterium tarhaniae]|uniref:hypothetical protein n=1 Tax=Methylobacterium tarhaniae TaxID=1187852 RepID=UPI003D0014A4
MLKIISTYLTAALSVAVSGCASIIPTFDIPSERDGTPTVKSIVNKINCELEDIVEGGQSRLGAIISDAYDVQVGVELSLTVTDTGGLAPTFSLAGGPITLATGLNFERSRGQNFTQQLFFSLRDIKKRLNAIRMDGTYEIVRRRCLDGADTNLSGRLGIKETFYLALTAGPYLDWETKSSAGVFGGSVNFIVNRELTATGPTWNLVRFTGPGSLVSASDKTNDKVTFAFAKGPYAGKGISENLKTQAQIFISDVRQNQIANSLGLISLRDR